MALILFWRLLFSVHFMQFLVGVETFFHIYLAIRKQKSSVKVVFDMLFLRAVFADRLVFHFLSIFFVLFSFIAFLAN